MTPPAWTRNKSKYKVYRRPSGGANVIHFSSNKKKTVVRVPKANASNVPAFLQKYFVKNFSVRRLSTGTTRVTKNGKTIFVHKNNNVKRAINKAFGPVKPPLSMNFKSQLVGNRQIEANNFFKNATNNGRTGSSLTSLNKKGLRTIYNVTKGKKAVRRGIAKLGGGTQAVVYLGYFDRAATKPVSLKVFPYDSEFPADNQPVQSEFKIGEKIHDVVPRHSPNYFNMERTIGFVPESNLARVSGHMIKKYQTVLLSEYFHGGDLHEWFRKVQSRLVEADIKDIIRQVLSTLVKIHAKYPEFRHNDLHTGNIFIDDTGLRPRAAIADFGLARLTSTLSNPIVNKGLFIGNGIGKLTDERYDAHCFLNSLLTLVAKYPRLKTYIETVLPEGYRGRNNIYVKNSRLKYGIAYPGLPSTKEMLETLNSVGKVTSPNLVRAREKLKTTTASNLVRAREKLKPVPKGTDAANIAAQALQGVQGVSVSKMSAANFLKMSPKSKASYLSTKKPVAKKPTALVFKKTTGNATASKKTNAGAYLKVLLEKKAPSPPKPKAPSPPKQVLKPAKNLLNSATKNKNVNAVTVRQLRTVLERYGYAQNNAKREARSWAIAWVSRVGQRRTNLKLVKRNNGRISAGKKLLEGHKKDELVAMARRHGLATNGKTKEQLINLLWKA